MSHFIHYPFWCPSFTFHYFILTGRLPYSQFFLWRKCLQQRCLWRKCQTWRWGVKIWGVCRSQGWGSQTSTAGGRTLMGEGCSLLRSMLEWQACRGSWLTGILAVRTAQDPTLLPRSGQGRVVGISALHAKCGVRSFVGQQHSAGAWKEVPEYPNEDNKNQNQEEQCRACQDDRHMHLPKKQRR